MRERGRDEKEWSFIFSIWRVWVSKRGGHGILGNRELGTCRLEIVSVRSEDDDDLVVSHATLRPDSLFEGGASIVSIVSFRRTHERIRRVFWR